MELRAAYELAVSLIDQHGLEGWRVDFDTAKRRAGVCRYEKRVIGLSAPLTRLHDEAEVRDTILHEIAHALVGPEYGHDETWRQAAVSIGCSGRRCVPADAPKVVAAWMGVCPAGHTADRHRRPERVLLCRACSGRPITERVFEWTYHGHPTPMHPNYLAELEALTTGTRLLRFGPGSQVRIVVSGKYEGRVATVLKRGKTRYHVQISEGIFTVPFAGVERIESTSS